MAALKLIADSSKRTKRRRIAQLEEHDESAASSLRSSDFQPNLKSSEANIEKVVSLLMDTGLTRHQYLLIREFVNCEVSYNLLRFEI